jgi:hypothetical protein
VKAILNREQLRAAYEMGGPVTTHRQIGDYFLVDIDGYTIQALGMVDDRHLVGLLIDARAKRSNIGGRNWQISYKR